MKIDLYVSTKSGDKYLSVPAGSDVNRINLPADLDPDLLSLTPLKTSLELDLSKAMVGINQENIQKQIMAKGYAIHGAAMDVDITMTGEP
jgi:hypothetical protein